MTIRPMLQPDAGIVWLVSFSFPSRRMAVSAGPYRHLMSLYVNSSSAPASFRVYWSPDTESYAVTGLTWSHNEDTLAFMGASGSKSKKEGEVWLYLLDCVSGNARKVLKLLDQQQGKLQRWVDVHQKGAVLAWLGNNKVCMVTGDDKSIIAINCDDGHVETLISAQDDTIRGPVSVSRDNLRFLKMRPSTQGREIEVCDVEGSNVIAKRIIPIAAGRITDFAWLSADGGYAFIGVKDNPKSVLDQIAIVDLSEMAVASEMSMGATNQAKADASYIPITILDGKELILFEQTRNGQRLCSAKL